MAAPAAASPQPVTTHRRISLRGVMFDALTQSQAVRHILDAVGQGRGGWVITSNLDHLRRAMRDDDFRAMLGQAELVVADGMPLVWAAKLAGTPLPERVAGSTMTTQLAAEAARDGRSVFLLGGNPGVAEAARDRMTQDHPGLKVVGTHCPPMGFEKDPAQMAAIGKQLANSGADLVLVALGSPKQEILIRELRGAGVLPDAWWMGIGITLSFLCGEVERAPGWMQVLGLEWVHRLVQEPRRLARRYLIEGLPFGLGLLGWSLIARLRGGPGTSEAGGEAPAQQQAPPTTEPIETPRPTAAPAAPGPDTGSVDTTRG